MAENKKSFILYSEWISVFDHLSDKEAGILIKHLFRYVNDQNPELTNKILKIAFEPIKQHLKRDLKKWESNRTKRSEAGKLGGLKSGESRRTEANEANASKSKQNEANEAVNANVNANVNVNVNERENTPPQDFWEKEAEKKYHIDHCLGIAMRDDGFVSRNKTNAKELQAFNDYLIRTGEDTKTLMDYKKHFANLKFRSPEKLKLQASKTDVDWDKACEEYDQKNTA